MNSYEWASAFRKLHERALIGYASGQRDFSIFFSSEEQTFLQSIGATPVEFYDFAEDYPELDFETALLITAVRRDYFLQEQGGVWSGETVPWEAFPEKADQLEGIPWLPRIILKAKTKLRGEMPQDLMYCCGGDRAFLQQFQIHPADFLKLVWRNWDNHAGIVGELRRKRV